MSNLSREQAILEYAKCAKNTVYSLKTYLQTYDNTQSQYVPVDLFPDQITLINDYDTHEENIALKYRQAGVSTVTSAWASKRLVFAKKTKPEKILIIANKQDTAIEMANKIRAFVDQWPDWMGVGFSGEKNAQKHFSEHQPVLAKKQGQSLTSWEITWDIVPGDILVHYDFKNNDFYDELVHSVDVISDKDENVYKISTEGGLPFIAGNVVCC